MSEPLAASAGGCLIGGFGPLPVRMPHSARELAEIVREASVTKQAIYPRGGGTFMDLGSSPTREGVIVDVSSLNRVVDFPAGDMTVTVEAGVTFGELDGLLRAKGLRVPVEVPHSERATVGGAIATNVSGPRRFAWGTFRDCVIGSVVVNGAGREISAGGRVVKNVAGYDLSKLHVGALGTLGILSQVTFKLRPRAAESGIVALSCPSSRLGDLLDHVHRSRTRPVSTDVVSAAACRGLGVAATGLPTGDVCLLVGFEGNEQCVRWQLQQLQNEIAEGASVLWHRLGPEADVLWQALTDFAPPAEDAVVLRARLRPSSVGALLRALAGEATQLRFLGHAGNGIVTAIVDVRHGLEAVRQCRERLARLTAADGGGVVVWRCPPPWKATLPVWGEPPESLWLMRRIKERFDPANILNPGRFVGGI